MKRSLAMTLTILLIAMPALAAAAKCEFTRNEVDAETGKRTVQTKWDRLVSMFAMTQQLESLGEISVIARGDDRTLVLKLETRDYVALPAQFAQLEDPSWDPAYRGFLDSLLGNTVIFPVGSSLRIDLDDQSSIFLHTTEHQRVRSDYTLPGHEPGSRSQGERNAKKIGGFLGKMLDKAMEKEGFESEPVETSPHYLVQTSPVVAFPIDAESAAILSRANVTGMRIESRDRYYVLGWRDGAPGVFGWSKKSYPKVAKALQCVNSVAGGTS